MPDSLPHEIVACDLAFPEGPVAMQDGSVLVVEIRGACLTRIRADGSCENIARWEGADRAGPNGAAIGPDGACYICNNGGFVWSPRGEHFIPTDPVTSATQPDAYVTGSIDRVDLETGEITRLYTQCAGQRLCGPNDLVFDSAGGIWVASPMSGGEVLRVVEGGDVTHRIRARNEPFACMLGGEDRRTLFVCSADNAEVDHCRDHATGAIEIARVDWPAAGLP